MLDWSDERTTLQRCNLAFRFVRVKIRILAFRILVLSVLTLAAFYSEG